MLKRVILLMGSVLLLTACGGGSGGGSSNSASTDTNTTTNQSPAGIWKGTATNSTGATATVIGIISEGNIARFISSTGVQSSGVLTVSGSSATGTLTGYAPMGYVFLSSGKNIDTETISATVAEKSTITGTATMGTETGTFSLSYDSAYDRAPSLSLLVGNWFTTLSTGTTVSMAVDASGNITGSTSTGCLIAGNFIVTDTVHNCYTMNVTLSSCGAYDGTLSGLAALLDSTTTNDTLAFGISSSTASISGGATKQ